VHDGRAIFSNNFCYCCVAAVFIEYFRGDDSCVNYGSCAVFAEEFIFVYVEVFAYEGDDVGSLHMNNTLCDEDRFYGFPMRGRITKEQHFPFLAASWYWHFVDAIWVVVFSVVYLWK
jgi:hypothetical protein